MSKRTFAIEHHLKPNPYKPWSFGKWRQYNKGLGALQGLYKQRARLRNAGVSKTNRKVQEIDDI